MNNKPTINEVIKEIGRSWRTPEMVVLLIIIGMAGAVLIIQAFYGVPVFLVLISLVLFFGIVVLSFYNNLRVLHLQKKSEAAAKQMGVVVENMNEGVIIYDPKFRIIKINPAAEKILNIKNGDIAGKTISPENVKHASLKTLAQIVFPSLAPMMNQISSGGWPQITELNTNDPDLRLITTLDRLTDENGETLSFVKIIKDKTRESQLIETKNEFITTAAHQLRTPVTAMSWGFEQLAETTKDNPETSAIAEEGKNLAARASKIINDLLSVIQIEEGKFGYKKQLIDVAKLIKQIGGEAKLLAKEYEISINTKVPEEKMEISADPERLASAFSALIENAILYNNRGGEVDIQVAGVGPESVEISINDTGMGISEEDLEKVFEKFYRGENSAQIAPNGSGLGLYIAKNIINAHGGKIKISSTLNRGTTVEVVLPIKN